MIKVNIQEVGSNDIIEVLGILLDVPSTRQELLVIFHDSTKSPRGVPATILTRSLEVITSNQTPQAPMASWIHLHFKYVTM